MLSLQKQFLLKGKEVNREIADDESVEHIKRLKRLQGWNSAQLELLELEWKDKRRAAEIEIQDKKGIGVNSRSY